MQLKTVKLNCLTMGELKKNVFSFLSIPLKCIPHFLMLLQTGLTNFLLWNAKEGILKM